jgi:DNA-binding SARP family transcriptional activator
LYQGYFLPELSGEDWVVIQNARFQKLYTECLEELVSILKVQGEYEEILRLCSHAAALYPFDEWQVYEMEALLAMGDGNGALNLYEETTAMYFDELAMPPSERMLDCFLHMREIIQLKTSNMKEVQEILNEKKYNKGEEEMVMIRQHHTPIIAEEVFEKAKKRMYRGND